MGIKFNESMAHQLRTINRGEDAFTSGYQNDPPPGTPIIFANRIDYGGWDFLNSTEGWQLSRDAGEELASHVPKSGLGKAISKFFSEKVYKHEFSEYHNDHDAVPSYPEWSPGLLADIKKKVAGHPHPDELEALLGEVRSIQARMDKGDAIFIHYAKLEETRIREGLDTLEIALQARCDVGKDKLESAQTIDGAQTIQNPPGHPNEAIACKPAEVPKWLAVPESPKAQRVALAMAELAENPPAIKKLSIQGFQRVTAGNGTDFSVTGDAAGSELKFKIRVPPQGVPRVSLFMDIGSGKREEAPLPTEQGRLLLEKLREVKEMFADADGSSTCDMAISSLEKALAGS